MSNKEEFKILSPRDHIRLRMNMYVGSSSIETVQRFVLGEFKNVTYVPAILKIIDEILDNSIDEAIRTNFAFANKIDLSISGDTITISDNGRGIPQDEVIDSNGMKLLRPEAAWTRVNAGTSFSDERTSIGANGVGSSCTNFLSIEFIGKTWRDGKLISVMCKNGGLDVKTTISKKAGNGTQVTFTPDFTLFDVKKLDEYDTINLIKDRLVSLSMCFPEIKLTFNGSKIVSDVNNFTSYAKLFGPENGSQYCYTNGNLSFLLSGSEDGYRQNCYVNGVNTRLGGSYTDYVMNGVIDELIPMIKRKYKVEVNKSTIKNGFTFVLFARNFVNPKYDSQTKERLTNSVTQIKEHFTESFKYDFKYIAKKIMDSEDLINPIIEAQINKRDADEARQTAIKQKELKRVKVAKHVSATSKEATLFLTEGDSAGATLIEVRNPEKAGFMPLRGVVKNVWTDTASQTLKNKEISELVSILGLDITDKDSYKNMNYANIAILSDADVDGGKIATLIVAFFYKYWPGIITEGKLKITRSPILIAKKGKKVEWFYTLEAAENLKKEGGWDFRYIKGLGSLEKAEYDKIINDPVFDVITVSDPTLFDMMFGDDAQKRKDFMLK